MDDPVGASVWLWRDRLVFTCASYTAAASSRPATTLLIGTRKEIRVTTRERARSGVALLVAPHAARAVAAEHAGIYSLTLEPTHSISRYLRAELLRGGDVVDVSSRVGASTLEAAASCIDSPMDCGTALGVSDRILRDLFPEALGAEPIDPRIERVTSWLRAHVPVRVDLAALADLCHLSPSRLTHLFTAELGTSLRRYLLWVKVRKTFEQAVDARPLAEIAHEIGFSDASHLSRTVKRYSGLTPSFLANPRLLRVRLCERDADPIR